MNDKEKLRILKKLDIVAARPMFQALGFSQAINDTTGKPMSQDDVILAAIHRARLLMPALFNKAEKAASRKWLYDNHMIVGSL